MSFSISGSGHIVEQESDGTSPVQTPAEIEAELAVKLHEVLSQTKYGVGAAVLYGLHGTVDLLGARPEVADSGDESDERDPDDEG